MSKQTKKFPEIIQFFFGLAKPFIEKGIENFAENGGLPYRKKVAATLKQIEKAQVENAEASLTLATITQEQFDAVWAKINELEAKKV